MNLKGKCYLGITERMQWTKRRLLSVPGVYRITDHGSHIKVNTREQLPKIPGFHTVLVKDETTHTDAAYWEYAMQAFRRMVKTNRDPESMVAIMVHYLHNLTGIPEVESLEMLAAKRKYINAAVSDQQAHGWELPHVQRLQEKVSRK